MCGYSEDIHPLHTCKIYMATWIKCILYIENISHLLNMSHLSQMRRKTTDIVGKFLNNHGLLSENFPRTVHNNHFMITNALLKDLSLGDTCFNPLEIILISLFTKDINNMNNHITKKILFYVKLLPMPYQYMPIMHGMTSAKWRGKYWIYISKCSAKI